MSLSKNNLIAILFFVFVGIVGYITYSSYSNVEGFRKRKRSFGMKFLCMLDRRACYVAQSI